MGAKPPNDKQIANLLEDPDNVVYGRPQVLNLFVILESYDQYSVTVRSFLKTDRDPLCRGGSLVHVQGRRWLIEQQRSARAHARARSRDG